MNINDQEETKGLKYNIANIEVMVKQERLW